MTEEFIPRDTPIYCFVANNEKDLDRARQTRDVWTKRWGYTNFIIQERISNRNYLLDILTKLSDKINMTQEQVDNLFEHVYLESDATSKIFNYSANFLYLLDKLKNKNQHSIIIQSNTLLKNDLPINYINNDITFFNLINENYFDIRDGLMINSNWAKAYDEFVWIYSKSLSAEHFKLKFSDVSEFAYGHQLIKVPVNEFTNLIPNCKNNILELKTKTAEEMHANIV